MLLYSSMKYSLKVVILYYKNNCLCLSIGLHCMHSKTKIYTLNVNFVAGIYIMLAASQVINSSFSGFAAVQV